MVRMNLFAEHNWDTDVENKSMGTKRGRQGWDELGDWDGHVHTLTNSEPPAQLGQPYWVPCGDLKGKEIQKGAGVYTQLSHFALQ